MVNKIEKENRRVQAENIRVKEENKKLKKRLSEFIFHKEFSRGAYQTVTGVKNMDNSLVVPLTGCGSPAPCDRKGFYQRKLSHNNFANYGRTFDGRATSFKQLPSMGENINNYTLVPPRSKYSTNTLKGSSFIFGDRKRSTSHDQTLGAHEGSDKY